MKYRYPDYYKKFECIADECEATCCAGWQIVIDDESLERYKNQKLDKYVDYKEECFFWQDDKEKRCSFLRDDMLCQMVIDMGEENLCDTCRLYPRHIEEFQNIREYSLGISCPVVARMILSEDEKSSYYESEDEKIDEEEYDEYEQEVYSDLYALREEMLAVLFDESKSLELRYEIILNMAASFQEEIDNEYVAEELEYEYKKLNISHVEIYDTQKKWEVIDSKWTSFIEECRNILFSDDYEKIDLRFREKVDFDRYSKKLTEYFLYTYFCGSAYDEYYYGQAQLAVVFALHIRYLVMALWIKNNEEISFDEIVKIVYLYARELEHSSSNVILMEQLMDEIRAL